MSAGSPHIPSSLPDTGPGDRQTDSTDGALRAALQALAATSQDGTPLLETREVPPPPPGKADRLHQCISGWGLFTCTPQADGGWELQGEGA